MPTLSRDPSSRRPIAIVLALSLASAPFASALAGPAEDKATARELAKDGIAAEQKGDCATAIDRLERAESLYHAPPHLQYLARCYAKVGRLVDATETWRRLTLETLPANAPAAFKDAVTEAQTKLPEVEPRLARLTIQTAESYPGLVVEVDGKAWPSAALGVPRVIDPGKHAVVARATGYAKNEQSVQLAEGKADSITVKLTPGSSDVGPAPSASATTSATSSSSVAIVPTSSASSSSSSDVSPGPWRTVGFVTLGVGGAVAVAGVVTGVIGLIKKHDLEQFCPPGPPDCPQKPSDVDAKKAPIKTLETTTTVLWVTGGVLAAAGLGLVLFGPKKSAGSSVSLQISPGIAGGHVALAGSF